MHTVSSMNIIMEIAVVNHNGAAGNTGAANMNAANVNPVVNTGVLNVEDLIMKVKGHIRDYWLANKSTKKAQPYKVFNVGTDATRTFKAKFFKCQQVGHKEQDCPQKGQGESVPVKTCNYCIYTNACSLHIYR
jgi:hypothetical protein